MTLQEKIDTYLQELLALDAEANKAGIHPQQYLNSHPDMMPIVGGENPKDQTEMCWLQDAEDLGTAIIFTDLRWEVYKVTYAQAKEEMAKRFPDAKVLKWYPDWTEYAYEQYMESSRTGCGCSGSTSCSECNGE